MDDRQQNPNQSDLAVAPSTLGVSATHKSNADALDSTTLSPGAALPDDAALIVEHTTELIAVLDSAGRFRFVTPAHAQLGYAAAALIGQPYADFIHPDDAELVLSDGQLRPGDAVVRFRCGDGHWRLLSYRIKPVVRRGEMVTIIVGRDVTVQQVREEQLIQAQRALVISALATGMIHDLNNMLTIIAGNAGIVAEALPANHPVQSDLATISAVTAHAGTLTHQVSTYVRNQRHERQIVKLNLLLHDVRALLERVAGSLISVTIDVASDLWPIYGVPGELTQALLGLVANAHEIMPRGGALTISARNLPAADGPARLAGDGLLLEMIHTGVGISATRCRGHVASLAMPEATPEGPGLGLVCCRRIIQAHGGSLHLAGAVGNSATLRILLPRA